MTIIFLTNTVVGFACSVGVDIGFNKEHHDDHLSVVKSTLHLHAPGTKKHSHHQEDAKTPSSHQKHKANKNKKDNCCKDEVDKFVSIDKQTVKSTTVKSPLLLQDVIVQVYGLLTVFASSVHTPDNSYFVRCHHPPICDIRIAVQSFQI
ncbi:hypothetical protein ACFOG5_02755 [Pedobacter fastidiosus]|uniref:Uncharacterized protein n=1 Tax=Pedobacter fastidiosus TaxID=2765361 RepID=A0ABR7KYL7_9SPHI|nr:hypothetical protein [Pedobacter fastidiosus]MBC6113098.1 hypothetical protein [Pedobacter fastidiosus]